MLIAMKLMLLISKTSYLRVEEKKRGNVEKKYRRKKKQNVLH